MPKGTPHIWTREELELVMATKGVEAHRATADKLGLTPNTIYSTRSRVRVMGGIDAFLDRQERMSEYGSGVPQTLAEQLDRVYTIRITAAGRAGTTAQYTVTLPPLLALKFLDAHGRAIRYVPQDDGILIIPVPRPEANGLPDWAQE